MKCADCRYYKPANKPASKGQCHRHAPRPSTENDIWFWPLVDEQDFCGDFNASVYPIYPGGDTTIDESNQTAVTVRDAGGYAIASFYYQNDSQNRAHYDALKLARRFADMYRMDKVT